MSDLYTPEAIVEKIVHAKLERDPLKGAALAAMCCALSSSKGIERTATGVWGSRMEEALEHGGETGARATAMLRDVLSADWRVQGPFRDMAREIGKVFSIQPYGGA